MSTSALGENRLDLPSPRCCMQDKSIPTLTRFTHSTSLWIVDVIPTSTSVVPTYLQIPPEFAHDVHGHGLNDGVGGGVGDGGNGSKGVRGGRKSTDSNRSSVGSSKQISAPGGGGNSRGHERSSSLGQSGMAPAAAAAAAAVTAAATAAAGGRGGGGGHIRTESGSALMGRREDCMAMEKGVWDGGGHGRLPSLDSVTGGLRNLHGSGGGRRNGNVGGQGVGTEVSGMREGETSRRVVSVATPGPVQVEGVLPSQIRQYPEALRTVLTTGRL